jgi:hypothetical protein
MKNSAEVMGGGQDENNNTRFNRKEVATPDPLERKMTSQQKLAAEKRLTAAREKQHDADLARIQRVHMSRINAQRER